MTYSIYMQEGDCALMEAAWKGETSVVKLLVEAGANLNMQNYVCHVHRQLLYWPKYTM